MALNSVVISDSTTLISLLNIGKFDLIFKFTEQILITQAVYDEVSYQYDAKKEIDRYILNNQITIKKVTNKTIVNHLLLKIDLGEAESIILAIEEKLPLIIDEKRGRKIAKEFNIETIGLVGILLIYKKKGYLCDEELRDIIDELKGVDFRISDTLVSLLLK